MSSQESVGIIDEGIIKSSLSMGWTNLELISSWILQAFNLFFNIQLKKC